MEDLARLSDDELIKLALSAATDNEKRRPVDLEMWRRQVRLTREANLISAEAGKGGWLAAQWAIVLGLCGLALGLAVGWNTTTNTTMRLAMQVYFILTVVVLAKQLPAVVIALREWRMARTALTALKNGGHRST